MYAEHLPFSPDETHSRFLQGLLNCTKNYKVLCSSITFCRFNADWIKY